MVADSQSKYENKKYLLRKYSQIPHLASAAVNSESSELKFYYHDYVRLLNGNTDFNT